MQTATIEKCRKVELIDREWPETVTRSMVRSLGEGMSFYKQLLPALGFTHDAQVEGWLQYEVVAVDEAPEFVGVAESPQYVANECRVAFPAKYQRSPPARRVTVKAARET